MKKSTFFIQLFIYSLVALAIAFIFQQFIMEVNHFPFLLVEIGIFILSAFVVHMLANNAAKSTNKYVFSRMTMANTFIKLFVVVGLVVIYKTLISPDSITFIWPFILIYVIFTIFETGFLLKLARL